MSYNIDLDCKYRADALLQANDRQYDEARVNASLIQHPGLRADAERLIEVIRNLNENIARNQ